MAAVAGLSAWMPLMVHAAEPRPSCSKEWMDAVFAHMDRVESDARKDGNHGFPEFRAYNACRRAHGLPPEPSFDHALALFSLAERYHFDVEARIQAHWERPRSVAHRDCRVRIQQLPGGEVMRTEFDAGCPYNEAERQSLVRAVQSGSPMPYAGYESIFQRVVEITVHGDDPIPGIL